MLWLAMLMALVAGSARADSGASSGVPLTWATWAASATVGLPHIVPIRRERCVRRDFAFLLQRRLERGL